MNYIYKLVKTHETVPWYEVAEIYQDSVSYFFSNNRQFVLMVHKETSIENLSNEAGKAALTARFTKKRSRGKKSSIVWTLAQLLKNFISRKPAGMLPALN